jgi:hypothetical protein
VSNGTPRVTMGNGEGFTTLILTDAESRLIRKVLEHPGLIVEPEGAPLAAFSAGIQRATARIQAEFAAEQALRKKLLTKGPEPHTHPGVWRGDGDQEQKARKNR